jgi:hypothetical protein
VTRHGLSYRDMPQKPVQVRFCLLVNKHAFKRIAACQSIVMWLQRAYADIKWLLSNASFDSSNMFANLPPQIPLIIDLDDHDEAVLTASYGRRRLISPLPVRSGMPSRPLTNKPADSGQSPDERMHVDSQSIDTTSDNLDGTYSLLCKPVGDDEPKVRVSGCYRCSCSRANVTSRHYRNCYAWSKHLHLVLPLSWTHSRLCHGLLKPAQQPHQLQMPPGRVASIHLWSRESLTIALQMLTQR